MVPPECYILISKKFLFGYVSFLARSVTLRHGGCFGVQRARRIAKMEGDAANSRVRVQVGLLTRMLSTSIFFKIRDMHERGALSIGSYLVWW